MPTVFLSHSSHDEPQVARIATALQDAGIGVWFSPWRVAPGHSVSQEISKGLDEADFVVLCLSADAIESGWVAKEWQSRMAPEATRRLIEVIPVRLDECEAPTLLGDKHYADFRRDFDRGVDELIAAIRLHSGEAALPAQPPEIPPAYLDWLWRDCADVDLLGQDLRRGQAITLDQVYVPAVTPARAGAADLAASDAARGDRALDLLLARIDTGSLFVDAPAGAGKTTFCRWAALRCHLDAPAAHPVPPPDDFAEPEPLSLRRRLTLFVRLRDFYPRMDAGRGERRWSRLGLEQALAAWVDRLGADRLDGRLLRRHLDHGTTFLMLDGLDEVSPTDVRAGVTVYPRERLVSALADALPVWERAGNRVLVTSRPYGLDEGGVARLGLERASLAPLPLPLQSLFVARWFHTLGRPNVAADALAAIRGRADLAPLVENPLLLTAVCVLYDNGKRLPQDRYDLYRSIVDVVLHGRYPGDDRQRQPVLGRLQAIAYGMHTGEPGEERRKTPASDISWQEVERLLAHFAQVNWAYEGGQVDAAEQREQLLNHSGLLVPRRDRRAAFLHFTLQDFLAAGRILRMVDDARGVEKVFRQRVATPEWRQTLLFLLAAKVQDRSPEWVLRLLERMLAAQKPLTRRANPAPMVFVAEALDLCLAKGYRVPEPLAARFRELALGAIEAEIDLQARQSLGLTLGRVGDPRVPDLRDPASYIEVPAGTYPVGDKGRKVEIAGPFRLGRFPVTNDQYRAFLEAGGYRDPRWWSDAGWSWREREGIIEPAHWREHRRRAPNQPVVGVSCWEAEACAAWAGGRLPAEIEWEAAARGTAGRTYPWGELWRDGICNTSEAGLPGPSPVGLFPASRHPDGIEDLAGNVWEWCDDQVGNRTNITASTRARGGSWANERNAARCIYRTDDTPLSGRPINLGFRVVCSSPISSAHP